MQYIDVWNKPNTPFNIYNDTTRLLEPYKDKPNTVTLSYNYYSFNSHWTVRQFMKKILKKNCQIEIAIYKNKTKTVKPILKKQNCLTDPHTNIELLDCTSSPTNIANMPTTYIIYTVEEYSH